MKRWPLRVALVMLALLVVALFAAWWHHTYKRVDRVLPLPPAGEAAYNPLCALMASASSRGSG